MGRAWIGVDISKDFHWALAIDKTGRELLSRRVENEQGDIEGLIGQALGLECELVWGVDMSHGPVVLLVASLLAAGQEVVFVPGLMVNRCRGAFVGANKTDALDARVIAENARMRHDLAVFGVKDDLLVSLRMLVERRKDLVADRTRSITRLRSVLITVFPGLERSLKIKNKGALVMLAHYQTPEAMRRAGEKRMTEWLAKRGVRGAAKLARTALGAARAQAIVLPGTDTAAALVARMATEILDLDARLATATKELETCFFSHPQARIVTSLPGMGPSLGAEFLAAVGDIGRFASADRLAAYAGLAPVSRDSGKTQGRLVSTRVGNHSLKRVFFQAAFASLHESKSRAYYDRKRSEGKRHNQAVLALARRKVDVLWAMLRDGTLFESNAKAA
ncbi:MAG: IS110 family transposase [Coriobacteriia bacterium]|nr:IS110 family transposase [Coriobacteriia bacterium]